jgi:hypothetical protein
MHTLSIAAVIAGLFAITPAVSQTAAPDKPETSCTADATRTVGQSGKPTESSLAMEKSAILPDAGGTDSAAPTVQSEGKPMQVRPDCPPDSRAK